MAFSIETLKNMMAQHIESNSLIHNAENEIAVNISSGISWPITSNEELDNVEVLLSNNRLVRNNQVRIK